jgi:alkylation response protein AidB-like acyl-CoA dehydrogenase
VVERTTSYVSDVLAPAAAEIESSPIVPRGYLDGLAEVGLYGLYGPEALGGWDADRPTGGRVTAALAGASLSTTMIWIQHHSVVRLVAAGAGGPRAQDRWLEDLVAGRVRGGIAYAALRRPGPPAMRAEPDGRGGWRLSGVAPWVTGWERIDVILFGAVHGESIVWALLDARPAPGLTVRPLRLGAVPASSTVELSLSAFGVAADRVLGVEPLEDWRRRDATGLRGNGYLAIGVAQRCAELLGHPRWSESVEAVRRRLDDGPDAEAVAARADASLLAARAADAVVVAGGGRSTDWDSEAQRLARDATFLLVFGQTAAIRSAQVERLRP